ncbi:MAG: alpha/beta fold hydrolase [Actinomycetota bacterium]
MESGRVGRTLLAGGIELSWWEQGQGPTVLCLHETAASGEIWRPLADALDGEARTVAPDRRGWGASGAPEQYSATTIAEQAEDAVALLDELDAAPALACGAGLGAVAALDLLLRRADLIRAGVLVEPPLLAFVPEATEGLSADLASVSKAVAAGGPAAALDLYLAGGLPYAGAGASRIPEPVAASAREHPLSLFAELPAVPAWSLHPSRMHRLQAPSRIVIAAGTPPPLRAAAEQLATHLGGSEIVRLGGEGLPHVDAAVELAAAVRALL